MKRTRKPFSLRLSPELVARIDACAERLRTSGLTISRTDVTRMLISRALELISCDPATLLAPAGGGARRGP